MPSFWQIGMRREPARKSTRSKINTPDEASAELHASDNYHACLPVRPFRRSVTRLKKEVLEVVASSSVRSIGSVRVTRTQTILDSPVQALSSSLFSAWLPLEKIYSEL